MTPDIATPSEDAARPSRLPRIARKLSAITLLAAALSCVRPYEAARVSHVRGGQPELFTAPVADDLRPTPQVALLYRANGADVSMEPASPIHLVGSLVRQVV